MFGHHLCQFSAAHARTRNLWPVRGRARAFRRGGSDRACLGRPSPCRRRWGTRVGNASLARAALIVSLSISGGISRQCVPLLAVCAFSWRCGAAVGDCTCSLLGSLPQPPTVRTARRRRTARRCGRHQQMEARYNAERCFYANASACRRRWGDCDVWGNASLAFSLIVSLSISGSITRQCVCHCWRCITHCWRCEPLLAVLLCHCWRLYVLSAWRKLATTASNSETTRRRLTLPGVVSEHQQMDAHYNARQWHTCKMPSPVGEDGPGLRRVGNASVAAVQLGMFAHPPSTLHCARITKGGCVRRVRAHPDGSSFTWRTNDEGTRPIPCHIHDLMRRRWPAG
jgi:hypothetical protein